MAKVVYVALSILCLRCRDAEGGGSAAGKPAPFNSLFEMLGVLVFGFCGFLSFCVGVCRFLAGVVDCGYSGFVFCVGAPRR